MPRPCFFFVNLTSKIKTEQLKVLPYVVPSGNRWRSAPHGDDDGDGVSF